MGAAIAWCGSDLDGVWVDTTFTCTLLKQGGIVHTLCSRHNLLATHQDVVRVAVVLNRPIKINMISTRARGEQGSRGSCYFGVLSVGRGGGVVHGVQGVGGSD